MNAEQTAVYDRQIRLWGKSCQEKLCSAKLLLCGAGPSGCEIAKNLVLAGVHSIKITDGYMCRGSSCSMWGAGEDAGVDRAKQVATGVQELNPMVNVTAGGLSQNETELEFTAEDVSKFDLVIVAECNPTLADNIGQKCHRNNVPLVVVETLGMLGTIYLCERGGPSLSDLLKCSWDGVTGAGSAATAIVSLVVRTHLLKRTTELASMGAGDLLRESKEVAATMDIGRVRDLDSNVCAAALEGVGVSVAAVSAVVGGFAGAESVRILTEDPKAPQMGNIISFDGERTLAQGFRVPAPPKDVEDEESEISL